MTGLQITALYAAFAALATLINLLVQNVVFFLYASEHAIYLAMPLGAVVGLVVKYVLDRTYIFAAKRSASGAEFFKYAATGGALTAVFFVFEFSFWALTGSALWRDLGAVIGLTIGYFAKYHIDKRFIFAAASGPQSANQEGRNEHA